VDTKTKLKLAEAVRQHLSRRLQHSGFARTKATFWTRSLECTVQFVHLHLFTFAPSFRVHLGIRVLNDAFPALALNGLSSHDGWALASRKYVFAFSSPPDTAIACADEIAAFVLEVGVPWFERFATSDALLVPGGPLGDDAILRLRLALDGRPDAEAIAASRRMLGIRA
jgi:hypothetical protein